MVVLAWILIVEKILVNIDILRIKANISKANGLCTSRRS